MICSQKVVQAVVNNNFFNLRIDNHDPQSSSSTFRVLPRAEQDSLTLRHDPQLLEVVAKYGESVVARLNETSQTAIVQEGVYIKMDCLPWLCKTVGEGSIIRWFKRRFRVDLNSGIVQSIHDGKFCVFLTHIESECFRTFILSFF